MLLKIKTPSKLEGVFYEWLVFNRFISIPNQAI